MEKITVKQMIGMAFAGVIFIFCLGLIWSQSGAGKDSGIGEDMGLLLMRGGERELISGNGSRLESILEAKPPEIRCQAPILSAGKTVSMKGIFQVRTDEDTGWKTGSGEEGFALFIRDILDGEGKSCMTKEGGEVLSYEEVRDQLTVYRSGIYLVKGIVWGEYGRKTAWEVKLAVEPE